LLGQGKKGNTLPGATTEIGVGNGKKKISTAQVNILSQKKEKKGRAPSWRTGAWAHSWGDSYQRMVWG